MTYIEVVKEIESRGVMPDRPPGLSGVREGLRRLAIELDPDRVVVVAGTNGKGSVCATLEALLRSAGQRVALYTSPHLVETTERIRVNGQMISREDFVAAYEQLKPKTDDLRLSHFEILTLMALAHFQGVWKRDGLDWVILEVGLGGTWDATNAIPHRYCVVTSISYDHQNLLGNSLGEIAKNKFGIVGPGAQVVYADLDPELLALKESVRVATGSQWVPRMPCSLSTEHEASGEPIFYFESVDIPGLRAQLALPGLRGAENSAIALTLFRILGFDPKLAAKAFPAVEWPGRMERCPGTGFPGSLYLSGDHNPAGMRSLIEILREFRRNHLHVLVGVGKDKDCDGILAPLFALPETSVYLTETPFRGRRIEEYGVWVRRAVGAWADPQEAFAAMSRRAETADLGVITGSLYLVGEFKKSCSREKMR